MAVEGFQLLKFEARNSKYETSSKFETSIFKTGFAFKPFDI